MADYMVKRKLKAVTKDINFGYEFSHFLNFPQQLASRWEDHQTIGNCLCHILAAPVQGAAGLALIHLYAGYYTALVCSLILSAWCIANDRKYGTIYSVYSISTTLLQLTFLSQIDLDTLLCTIALTVFIQLGIGHGLFERRLPNETEGIHKGDGKLFAAVDIANEVILATFHFYSLAMVRLGYRPDIYPEVRQELNRIQNLLADQDP
ncbi:uncharacterized protein [Watersipora subatra]|uniref:uncharacterized protein n=1 Tax=Watersipora subatra TaxID=2589382 RepID=UPI00355B91AE